MNICQRLYCRSFQFGFKIAMPLLPYREPKLLHSVEEIPPLLREAGKQDVLLVTDENLRRLGLLEELLQSLERHKIRVVIYDETAQNPTVQNIEAAANRYRRQGCGAIIAFGGGSPMDCAKGAGALLARPDKTLGQLGGVMKVWKKTPLTFAIPTTAGTGSEVTLAAVITDPKTARKYSINDFPLIPDYAVLDAGLTLGLPPQLTATTGMDALTHAVEAYIGHSTTPYTRFMSEQAVNLISSHLETATFQGDNLEARSKMQLAAYYAGNAFTRSYVGYVHAISHALSGRYHMPHGLTNAVILPHFLEAYGEKIDRPLARLAVHAGLADPETEAHFAANAFRRWVWQMNERLGIPKTLAGIRTEDIPALAKHAAKEGNPLYPVPVLMTEADLAKMIVRIRETE